MRRYELPHKLGGKKLGAKELCLKIWRRAWDLNPRRFPLPVFKTGALGHYASPPWENLPSRAGVYQINAGLTIDPN